LNIEFIILVFLVLFALLTPYCAGERIDKIEMDGTWSADEGGERRTYGFDGET
jgi:hypothetical protein